MYGFFTLLEYVDMHISSNNRIPGHSIPILPFNRYPPQPTTPVPMVRAPMTSTILQPSIPSIWSIITLIQRVSIWWIHQQQPPTMRQWLQTTHSILQVLPSAPPIVTRPPLLITTSIQLMRLPIMSFILLFLSTPSTPLKICYLATWVVPSSNTINNTRDDMSSYRRKKIFGSNC